MYESLAMILSSTKTLIQRKEQELEQERVKLSEILENDPNHDVSFEKGSIVHLEEQIKSDKKHLVKLLLTEIEHTIEIF
jgi:translation initiation factor 2 beta subunit (eIF-2beta)/eIF-5